MNMTVFLVLVDYQSGGVKLLVEHSDLSELEHVLGVDLPNSGVRIVEWEPESPRQALSSKHGLDRSSLENPSKVLSTMIREMADYRALCQSRESETR